MIGFFGNAQTVKKRDTYLSHNRGNTMSTEKQHVNDSLDHVKQTLSERKQWIIRAEQILTHINKSDVLPLAVRNVIQECLGSVPE